MGYFFVLSNKLLIVMHTSSLSIDPSIGSRARPGCYGALKGGTFAEVSPMKLGETGKNENEQ